MADKITITERMFLKAYSEARTMDEMWTKLVLESQRKEPIERWAVGLVLFNEKEDAEDFCKFNSSPLPIIHLREVVET